MSAQEKTKLKVLIFILIFAFSLLLYYFLTQFSWNLDREFHTIVEILSSFLGLIIGILILAQYYTKKNNTYLILGVTFIGSSILDAFNAVITTSFYYQLSGMLTTSLLYWSWFVTRLFFASMITLSLWTDRIEQQKGESGKINEKQVYIVTLLSVIIIILLLNIIPLPAYYFNNYPFHRIHELVPAFLFLIAVLGYIKKGNWRYDHFEFWLVISLILNYILQGIFIPSSFGLYDTMFSVSYILKIISYVVLFVGLIISTYTLFKQAEESKDLLTSQNLALKETRMQLEETLKNSLIKEADLATKVRDLENTKKAIFNVLDDLNDENTKVEEARVKDEAILSSIGDGMVVTDKQGNITMVNDQAELMLGWIKDELIGKKWSEIIIMEDEKGQSIPSDQKPIQIALTQGLKTINSNYSYIRKDNTKLAIATTASPVIINKETGGAILVFRDITKEREIDRMKTEFISLASHQLRTPLSAIKWFSEMLEDGDAGELNNEQKSFVQNISESTERMIALVNSLLNISRIESGRIIIDPQPTDIGELVKSLINEIQLKLQVKKHKLIISIHNNLPKINLDPKLIRQVFMNLLTNAIKYTPENGEISIIISKKEDEILTQISDNGYGIPKVEANKVFQKFYRGNNIIKIETDGTGLGLYLVKAIIESSKGKIWFDSIENKGTTFWFSLPLSGTPPKKGEVTLDS